MLIFDVMGRTIALYKPQRAGDGSLTLDWDGRGRAGELVSPGVYFVRWENGTVEASGKVVVVQ